VVAAGLPKGSFYTYFESKEAFGGAVLDSFVEQGQQKFKAAFAQTDHPLEGFRRFFATLTEGLVQSDFQAGCLLGNLANELGSQAEQVTPHLERGLDTMAGLFAERLALAQAAGLVRLDLPPEALGDLLLNGWEGALIRAKAKRSTAPLDQFVTLFFDQLLPV